TPELLERLLHGEHRGFGGRRLRLLHVASSGEREQGTRDAEGQLHRAFPRAFDTAAVLTQTMEGRPSASRVHDVPLSREAKSFPLRVPKYTPAFSKPSVVRASRSTVSRASF